jgi:hypothetical protein
VGAESLSRAKSLCRGTFAANFGQLESRQEPNFLTDYLLGRKERETISKKYDIHVLLGTGYNL